MNSQVIQLRNSDVFQRSAVRHRLAGILAVFEELEAEEMLAALPECQIAKQNHLAALNLLLGAEAELRALWIEFHD